MGLLADPRLRVADGGRLLVGGYPGRLVRLTPAGAALVGRWLAGEPLGPEPAAGRLARRLLDAAMLHPRWAPAAEVRDVTVVVPTLDRAGELDRCLRAVRAADPSVPVLVVDDGSADPRAVGTVAARRGATVLRHPARRGAAAARNTGLRVARTALVAFVDSDVVVPPDWLARLRPYFADPVVAAVAPRVAAHQPGPGWLAAYETAHSPLDMGSRPGQARPGSPVPYVPTATLLVRRAAVGRPFDEELPIGEDVDLEWRLVEAGWTVHHVPEVSVAHEHRERLGPFVARRRVYARSIGLLDTRHPGALPAARLSPPLAAAWLLLAARRPVLSAAAAAVGVGLLARALRGSADHPVRLAARLAATALPATGEGLARAVERLWWPPLAVAAIPVRGIRAPLAVALAAPAILDWVRAGRRPSPHRQLAVRALGTVVSTAGTWEGCWRARTVRPLLPVAARPRRAWPR